MFGNENAHTHKKQEQTLSYRSIILSPSTDKDLFTEEKTLKQGVSHPQYGN